MSTRLWSRQFILRWTALLLAMVSFWISGIATLRHTDDMSAFLTFRAGHSAFRHADTPTPHTPCAACEWEQSLATPHTPAIHITAMPFGQLRYAVPLARATHILPFDFIDLRGPPTS
jgi:hypothetical protein